MLKRMQFIFAFLVASALITAVVGAQTQQTHIKFEAESGTRSGSATLINDSAASGSQGVIFNAAPQPPPPGDNPLDGINTNIRNPQGVIYAYGFENATIGPYNRDTLRADLNSTSYAGSVASVGVKTGQVSAISENGSKVLRIRVPGETCCFSAHSTNFSYSLDRSYDTLYFSYRVRVDSDFDPVRGGKLVGFCGGGCNTGGNKPNGFDGWSARNMWVTNGRLTQYVYHPGQATRFGDSILYGNNESLGSTWKTIEHKVVMNNPNQFNGSVEGWVNGRKALTFANMQFRKTDAFAIDTLMFQHFYGGATMDWAPPKDNYFYFDDFIISTMPITH